ncbi:MAG: asparagine synthase C-terminal domain-containing protein [Lachnospiraceae bacterium]|nr:asparagine synthase C-terminal domain-containing protein [Lachnospiraceae bacterium]
MLEKIYWGMTSLSHQNFNKYLVKECNIVKCQNFSFWIQEENLFIRSNFPEVKNNIKYHNYQNKTVPELPKQVHSNCIVITKSTHSVNLFSDLFGIHSLYWSKIDGGIIFSNSSYFLAKILGKSPLGIEGLFIHLILRGQQNNTSYFNDIFQLAPQSVLKLEESGINISKRELSAYPNASMPELLLKNVPSDMVARSGICFSGGIDSSVIVKECLDKYRNIACYSLINSRNENLTTDSFFADKLASQWHFTINKVPFQINKEIIYYDMPILDHDIYGQYCLAQAMIRDGKSYMICGSGADELFGGYDRIFHYAYELSVQHCVNPLDCILQRYSYTDFNLLQNIDNNLFIDIYHRIKAYYQNITDSSYDLVTQLHHWFIYHHLFWILKMHPNDLICIYPYLQEEFLSFCIQNDYKNLFPYIMVEPGNASYHAKVKDIIKQQYKHSLPTEILNRPKLPFSVQEKEINQWYELQYAEKQPDCLISPDIFAEIMAEKYGSQTKLLFLSYILWRQRVL